MSSSGIKIKYSSSFKIVIKLKKKRGNEYTKPVPTPPLSYIVDSHVVH